MQGNSIKIKLSRNVSFILVFVISIFLFSIYYYCTTAANSFGLDQYKIIEYSKGILEGNFRLVGMRTSRLNWNFPMIHYLLAPLAAITINPLTIFFSTAVTYVIGIWSISWILYKNRTVSEFLIFIGLSITHV